jgi:hypothetical protein
MIDRDQIERYIPQALRDLPLFKKVALLLSWITTSDEVFDMDYLRLFGDALQTKDIDRLQKELGADTLIEVFGEIDDELRRKFLSLIKTFYQLKGTARGLKLFFSLLGVPGLEVYEWYEIDDSFEIETPNTCAVLIRVPERNVGLTVNPNQPAIEGTRYGANIVDAMNDIPAELNDNIIALTRFLIHVCVEIIVFRKINIYDIVTIVDSIANLPGVALVDYVHLGNGANELIFAPPELIPSLIPTKQGAYYQSVAVDDYPEFQEATSIDSLLIEVV